MGIRLNFRNWIREQDRSFVIAQITGFVMMLFGIVFILINVNEKFSVTNLKPVLRMAAGFFIGMLGLILVSVSYRVRWQHMVEKKLNMLLWVTGMADEEEENGCGGCCDECGNDCGGCEQDSQSDK